MITSPDYDGNAYIEALPPPLSRSDWVLTLNSLPEHYEGERRLSHQERYLRALRLTRFFRASTRQAEFARGFDAMLREGYRGRDSTTRAHEARQFAVAVALEEDSLFKPGVPVVTRNASSAALIGLPGMGKTKTMEGVLARYPQVVDHESGEIQIVWIKLDCPHRGSLRMLCADFFMEVDRLLGQDTYQKLYAGNSASEESMMRHMVVVANRHSIGCLVVDEIQHLGQERQEEHLLMTFLTTLINKIGVPVLFAGTMSAFERFEKTGRMGRRAIGPASAVWPNYKKTDNQWKRFVQELWGYQWTSEPTPLDEGLLDVLHDETQGIVDLVVKLWFAVQVTLIDRNESTRGAEPEIITADIIRKTAEQHFGPVEKLLSAIRSGDPKKIAKFEDVAHFNTAFFKSLGETNGSILNDELLEDVKSGERDRGPAYDGQNATIVRENLMLREFSDSMIAEVMRRTSAAVGVPEAQNMGQYFFKLEEVIAEMSASAEKPKRIGAKPTKEEIEATYIDGDLRRLDEPAQASAT